MSIVRMKHLYICYKYLGVYYKYGLVYIGLCFKHYCVSVVIMSWFIRFVML